MTTLISGNGKIKVELTLREFQMLRHIANGVAHKNIAHIYNISIKTVEKHQDTLNKKLNLHCGVDLTHFALSAKIITNKFDV